MFFFLTRGRASQGTQRLMSGYPDSGSRSDGVWTDLVPGGSSQPRDATLTPHHLGPSREGEPGEDVP